MTYAERTGQFSTLHVTGLPLGQTVTLDYGQTELAMMVHGTPIPEPTSALMTGVGILALAWGCG